jgi:aldehyde dehydrogenase (NAD+)
MTETRPQTLAALMRPFFPETSVIGSWDPAAGGAGERGPAGLAGDRRPCGLGGDRGAGIRVFNAGKPIRDCRVEATKVAEMFEYYAGWADKLHGEVIGEGGQLGGFEHHRVAGGERRGELPAAGEDRGVPGRDCRVEATKVAEMFEYYAGWADKLHGEVIPVPTR